MKNILIPTGYMSSGSSAVTDLISEFDGYFADYGSHEYVFLHCPNGLFDLEDKLLIGNNAIRSDEALHTYYHTMSQLYDKKYWWVGHYKETFGPDFLKHTEAFMDDIILTKTQQYWYYQENTSLKMGIRLAFNKILKKVTLNKYNGKKPLLYPEMWLSFPNEDEFYSAAKKYLNSLFLMIGNDQRNLILDQLLLPFNLHRLENYFDTNAKVIVVERDPRDVYLLNKYVHSKSNETVPYPTNPKDFCVFYKKMRQSEIKFDNDQILRIHFEDLIYKYDDTLSDIMELLELQPEDHKRPNTSFNPEISINNTQVFLNRPEYKEEIAIISAELEEYLYEFPYERESDTKLAF
ncbi:sulfotransferase [Erysipelothrix sp. HDW6A]|uniref:sulfotransferase n=1 Tax=Erysipelothrix sp. HDW6A TaxID=2714928 RepID=UPI00140CABB6|nr:sulfotransferase [Erysipelothrix sp. HDW6A]QIK57517.1 sulfotransferase [Erysipelothrix sp. HDW6A]